MDFAFDRIVEESLPKDSSSNRGEGTSSGQKPEQQATLNEEVQVALRASQQALQNLSNSSWGSWFQKSAQNLREQTESVVHQASQEVNSLGLNRGIANLRARAISITTGPSQDTTASASGEHSTDRDADTATTPTTSQAPRSSSDETYYSRLRTEAAKRFKDIQRAEDAADEALLKFGTNVRDFFRDAIIVNSAATDSEGNSRFESKDESGKRVIHSSRYDAQLHVLHTAEKSFTEDPATAEFEAWAKDFDAEAKTESISADLAKYPELRTNMEKLVPGRVPYADFWKRYYFLRHSVDTAEARRRDLLKAASAEEEVGWGDEDSDDESVTGSKPTEKRPRSTESSTTIHPPAPADAATTTVDKSAYLKPSEPRKSNDEKSQADSDTSYDVVGAASGNPSQAPSSPKESRKTEDSDDDEWE
ncbi:BSD-domain-containing protein [Xylariaceae sp. FL1019]|nr:BSD-domain-containing protein [Xylariaceae sp. FL1019]